MFADSSFPNGIGIRDPRLLHVIPAALIQDLDSSLGIADDFDLLFERVRLLVLFLKFLSKFIDVGFVLVEYFLLHDIVHFDGSLCLF